MTAWVWLKRNNNVIWFVLDGSGSTAPAEMCPTFPYDVLKFLLGAMPTESNEGTTVRDFILSKGVFRFIALSLGVFSQTPYEPSAAVGVSKDLLKALESVSASIKLSNAARGSAGGNGCGWAKGTGYGAGKVTGQSAKTLEARELKRSNAEKYVISIFNLLTNFINPGTEPWRSVQHSDAVNDQWRTVIGLLQETPILEVVATSLNNDSCRKIYKLDSNSV